MTNLPAASMSKMQTYLQHQMDHKTTYGLGSKAPSLGADACSYNAIDCSGEARVLLYHGTEGALVIPDGSATQHEWCETQGLHKVAYGNLGSKDAEGRLFIAFIAPHPVGHVWLVNGTTGETLESHGGGAGPDYRAWDDPILVHAVCACYELPCVP